MTININGAVPVWENPQWLVVYQGANAPKYPQVLGTLVASTDTDTPKYYSGRLLSVITQANAADPSLVGMFLNYDPDSSNPDQQVPTHILSDQWINGLVGYDYTSQTTRTATYNQVNVTPLLIGTTLYYNTLESNNPTAAVDGFNAYFTNSTITNILLNGNACPLISIQGVQA